MNTEEFVKGFYTEKKSMLKAYFSEEPDTAVGHLIQKLNLNEEQTKIMKKIIDVTLIDTYYSILLGLEGSASIGGTQEIYDIKDKNGIQLNDGDIGGYAYEYFQENENK